MIIAGFPVTLRSAGMALAVGVVSEAREEAMLSVHVEKIGDLAIVECQGRLVRSEAAFQIREAIPRKEARKLLLLISRK